MEWEMAATIKITSRGFSPRAQLFHKLELATVLSINPIHDT